MEGRPGSRGLTYIVTSFGFGTPIADVSNDAFRQFLKVRKWLVALRKPRTKLSLIVPIRYPANLRVGRGYD